MKFRICSVSFVLLISFKKLGQENFNEGYESEYEQKLNEMHFKLYSSKNFLY